MIKAIIKFLRITIYSVLVIAGVVFAVSNRQRVDLSFFPLGFTLSVPLFVVSIFLFSAGAATAWLIVRVALLKDHLENRKNLKRMQALENEIAALRSEKLVSQQQVVSKPLSLAK